MKKVVNFAAAAKKKEAEKEAVLAEIGPTLTELLGITVHVKSERLGKDGPPCKVEIGRKH